MRCVACKLCVENCPSHCIFVEPAAYPDPSKGNYPKRYEIDITRCIFCGYCEDACPTEAIVLGDNYELSFTERSQAIYGREMLLDPVPEDGKPTPQKVEPGKFDRAIPEMKNPE